MKQAPTDKACHKAWDRIAAIAREHALVVHAAGGSMILGTPDAQREAGIRDRVLGKNGYEKETLWREQSEMAL